MSDLPAKNFSPSILRVSDRSADSKSPAHAPRRGEAAPSTASTYRSDYSARASVVVVPPPALTVGKVFGFLILLVGVILATIPFETWGRLVWWVPPQWTTESYRWISVGILAVGGLLFMPSRAISVVVTSVFFAVTAYGADRLLHDRMSDWLVDYLGVAAPRYGLAIASLAFGYWVHAGSTGQVSLRGAFGLALTLLAAFGTIHGWYDWSPIAERLGPGVIKVLRDWGQECTWATVLVLTALGVSSSRTRPIHFLIAVLLGTLAYYCVREGFSQTHLFPTLSKGDAVISVDSMSYSNVELWRWIVAAELTLLATILLHLAAGVGGLSMAAAMGWMMVGLSLYHSVGSMSLVRSISDAAAASAEHQARVDPLANMGIPVNQSPRSPAGGLVSPMARTPSPATTPTMGGPEPAASPYALDASARQALVREIAPMAWMFLTAAFAGIIAVCGFNLLSDRGLNRSLFNSMLWFGFGIALTALVWVWPRDADRSWEAWFASWRMSRYHLHTIWLLFLGTMAVASMFSLGGQRRASTWVHLGAAAAFVGTAASLATIAILIYFGGFSQLPPWVYVAVAVVQSSMGWILLTNLSLARVPSSRSVAA